ncbi:hypothetical protein [Agitococcus lubricus]|uniref:Uncharacterized protein n=1 Tax=Agitococcus lubricus TaxID=1077255 RepID=A0A2T5J0B8_9GAMM|nr:hypothetical protein [Agitococcus lubricus]PTQ89789.1 hypothetical protein C8N29_105114 [Agitococcus lubricus]
MPARKRDFIIEKGADFQRQLFLKAGPDADIRDFTARMQVRSAVSSEVVVLDLTTENGGITCDYGVITINVTAAITTALDTSGLNSKGKVTEPGPIGELPYESEGKIALYDLELISPSGIVTRYLEGRVAIVDNVTR